METKKYTASSLTRYIRNGLIGLASLGAVATTTTSCGKKDDPQPSTTIVTKQDSTINAKTTPTITVTPTPPVDPVTPVVTTPTLKDEFVKIAPDVFAVDSVSARKLLVDGSQDSVLLNVDGAPTSLRFLKQEGDTLFFNQTTFNTAMDPKATWTYKFTKDKATSQLVETLHANAEGAPTAVATLSKGADGTSKFADGVKKYVFSTVDQLNSKILNVKINTYNYIKRIK